MCLHHHAHPMPHHYIRWHNPVNPRFVVKVSAAHKGMIKCGSVWHSQCYVHNTISLSRACMNGGQATLNSIWRSLTMGVYLDYLLLCYLLVMCPGGRDSWLQLCIYYQCDGCWSILQPPKFKTDKLGHVWRKSFTIRTSMVAHCYNTTLLYHILEKGRHSPFPPTSLTENCLVC